MEDKARETADKTQKGITDNIMGEFPKEVTK